ncbi:unnamed protein product, partial [Symbiodinium microadriaticum]
MESGDVVFVVCHGSAGDIPVTGWIVELEESEAFLAAPLASVAGVPNQAKGKSHGVDIAFIRVPVSSLSLNRPENWSGLKQKDLPPWEASAAAWKQVNSGNLSSSEAERPAAKSSRKPKSRVEMDLGALGALFRKGRDDADEEDETDDDEDAWEPASHLRPGAPASSRGRGTKEAKPKKDSKEPPDLKALLAQSLASGQSSNDLVPLMMMTMLLDKDKKGSQRRRERASGSSELLGGGSSEDSEGDDDLRGKGMRAVSTLHRLHAQVEKRPRRICEIFEKEVIEELGVPAGASWTLKDYVKRQPWGKFKGIYRCAIMDVAAYEMIRQGKSDQAAAQLVQNLKAKIQSVLAQGDWQAAWLLTGLPDPLVKKEFGGSKEEMSIVAEYMSSLAKLKKRVKEVQNHGPHEEDEEVTLVEVVSDRGQACDWWGRAFVNTFVAWSNFLVLGCPRPGSSTLEPRVVYRADVQEFALKLLGEVSQFASFELVAGLLECQGKRSVLEDMLKLNFASYGGAEVGVPSGALSVSASRVAIPDAAGRVDPLEWLPPDQAAVVGDLEAIRLPEHLWEDVVVACHRVPEVEESALAEKLLETGMAELVKEADLPHTSEGKLLVGGLFCVGKNEGEDRLIFDRRPENSTMPRLAWEELPSGACFTRMLLEPNQYLRGSGDDLRNFYYMLRLPQGWVRFNSVGRRVCSKVVQKYGGDPRVAYRLCFRVLGMGDRNGCSIAQATHEAILRKFGILRPENRLVYGKFVPEDDLWEGVYLDDLLVTLRVTLNTEIPLDGSFQPPAWKATDRDIEHTKVAEDAYEEAGLQRATHKAFRGTTKFKAWGAKIDGVRGTVGAPLEMRRQVWSLISKTVQSGTASKEILQKLLGFIAFIFQYRREMFSLIHHLYMFVEKLKPGRKVWLPAFVLDELRSVALHLPMAQWCMRKRLHESLLATDATPTSGGAVRATVSPSLLRELWRRSELRGSPVRLDRDNMNIAGEAPLESSRFAAAISESLPWEVVGCFTFRKTSHINLQEARALRREIVKFTGDFNNAGSVQVALNDSLVVVGSVSKGRIGCDDSGWPLLGCSLLAWRLDQVNAFQDEEVLSTAIDKQIAEGEVIRDLTVSLKVISALGGPLLKNTWIQLRGWRRLEPIKTRADELGQGISLVIGIRSQLQFAGRWSRPETLQHYLQEALSVQVVAQVNAAAAEATGAATRAFSPGGSSVAYRTDHRCYIVVSNPRVPDFVGFFEGEGAAAWKAIERQLPGMGRGLARASHADASADDVNAAAVPADQLLQAVQQAATDLGSAPVDSGLTAAEVLADPHRREVATRWRAGSSLRKFTSVLARMSQALQACSGVAAPQVERGPGAGRPRSLLLGPTQASAPTATTFEWLSGVFSVGQLRRYVPQLRLRTVAVALVVLLFPRLCALLLALVVRLLLRAAASLVSSLFQEVWVQVMGTVAEVEHNLVEWLQAQMGIFPSFGPSPPPLLLQSVAQPPPAQSPAASTGGNPHPARPLAADVVTWLLLLLNL